MATVSLGKVKFSWKAAYAGGTTYNAQDVVSYNGTTYVCVTDGTSGVVPATVTRVPGTGTEEYYVKVQADGGANYFYVDVTNGSGTYTKQRYLKLIEGKTYKIYQNDASNNTHPLLFSSTSDGTHGGGAAYTSGVTYYIGGSVVPYSDWTGSAFTSATDRYIQIVVPISAPNLYYYCFAHSGMGGTAPTAAASTTVAIASAWNQFTQGVDFTGSVEGDILYYDGTSLVSLPVGSENQILKIDESTLLPIWSAEDVRSGTKVAQLRADSGGSLASNMVQMTDGSLRWWGTNSGYKGGIGYLASNRSQPINVAFPQSFPGIENVSGNFLQNYNSTGACIDKNKHLWTWGRNLVGSMGIGNATAGGPFDGRKGVPVNISTRTNNSGGIGHLTTEASRKKIVQLALPYATDGASDATIVRDEDGYVYGTGYNAHGMMGQSGTAVQYEFKTYPTFGTSASLKAASIHLSGSTTPSLMTLTAGGDLYHTGYAAFYQHGENNTTAQTSPTIVPTVGTTNGVTISKVAAYSHEGVHAIDSSNNLWTWGTDTTGFLGRGGVAGNYYQPTNVLANVTAVSVSKCTTNNHHSLVIRTDGTVWASGYNAYGQLGHDSTTATSTYAESQFRLKQADGSYANQTLSAASNPFTVTKVLCGGGGVYGISACMTSEGKMYACGYNGHGQIGQGQTGNVYNVFTEIEGLQGNVVDISCQGYASTSGFTALMDNGSCFTWGNGAGYMIPEDDAANFYTPKPILF